MRAGSRWTCAALAGAAIVAGLQAVPAGGQLPTHVSGCTQKAYRSHGNFTATLHAPGHRPSNWHHTYSRDQKKVAWIALWNIRVTGSHAGHAINGGRIMYQFLFNKRIVACRPVAPPGKPRFTRGVMRDRIEWPERSIGIPLVFRVVVFTQWGVKNLDYSVKVQPRH